MRTNFIIGIFFLSYLSPAIAGLNVVTTTTDLKSLIQTLGGDVLTVDSIAKGTQDPHFIEAKPSYMVKVSKADLVVSNGLDLEVGWLPSILRGARNPKVQVGSKGYFEAGSVISPLELPAQKQTRAEGDVHPFGNPHFMLDPVRAGQVAEALAKKLSELDPTNKEVFMSRAQAFKKNMDEKTLAWQERVKKSGVKDVVTYHKTLTYFLDRFHLNNPAILEPKPGIPPTAPHIVEVTKLIKEKHIPLIMVENYFEMSAAERIAKDVPGLKVKSVPVAAEGDKSTPQLKDVYENLIQTVEGKNP